MKLSHDSNKRRLKSTFHALLVSGLISTGTLSSPLLPSYELTAAEKEGLDAAELIKQLKEKKNLGELLAGASAWDENIFTHRKFSPTLLGLLNDTSLSKSESFAVFEAITLLSIEKEAIEQDAVAEALLKAEPDLTSPNLKLLCIETLVSLDAIKSSSTTAKIEKLMSNIVSDASLDLKKQKYPSSLHATCLRAMDIGKMSSSQFSKIASLVSEIETAEPQFRLALFETVGNIASSRSSALKKSIKSSLTQDLIKTLSAHPALSKVGASPQEQEDLTQLIYPIGALLSDEDNTIHLSDAAPDLIKALEHPHLEISATAGQALLSITKANSPRNKTELELEIFKLIKTPGKSAAEKAKEVMLYDLLGKTFEVLLGYDNAKDVAPRLERCINSLHRSVMTHVDMGMREKALLGLFALEPKHFEDKRLNKDSRKTIKKLISDCAGVMGNKALVEKLPKLVKTMADVLHEITGKNYGTDPKQWNAWLSKEGKELLQ